MRKTLSLRDYLLRMGYESDKGAQALMFDAELTPQQGFTYSLRPLPEEQRCWQDADPASSGMVLYAAPKKKPAGWLCGLEYSVQDWVLVHSFHRSKASRLHAQEVLGTSAWGAMLVSTLEDWARQTKREGIVLLDPLRSQRLPQLRRKFDHNRVRRIERQWRQVQQDTAVSLHYRFNEDDGYHDWMREFRHEDLKTG